MDQPTTISPPNQTLHLPIFTLNKPSPNGDVFFVEANSPALCAREQRPNSRESFPGGFLPGGCFNKSWICWILKVTWVVKSHKLRRWSFGIVWWDLMKLDFLDWRFQRTSLNYAGEDAHVFLCQEYVLDFGISWIVFFRLGMALLVVGRSIKKGDCTHPTPLIQNGQRQGRMGNKNHQACQPMYRPTLRSQCCSSRWMNLYWKLSDCNMTG